MYRYVQVILVCILTSASSVNAQESATGQNQLPVQNTAPSLDDVDHELNKMIEEARALESIRDFGQATTTWSEIERRLTESFGADSWQAVNARLAKTVAHQQSQFSAEQLEEVAQIAEHQKLAFTLAGSKNGDRAKLIAEAIDELGKARNIVIKHFGNDCHLLDRLNFQSAQFSHQIGEVQTAYEGYRGCLQFGKQHYGRAHPDVESANLFCGKLLHQNNQSQAAIPFLQQAAALASEIYGSHSVEYAVRANELGVVYVSVSNFEQAIQQLSIGESIRRDLLGEDHEERAHSLLNLGIAHSQIKDYSNAISHLENAATIFQSKLGQRNIYTLETKDRLIAIYVINQQVDEATSLLREVVRDKTAKLGNDHPSTARSQFQLGIMLSRKANYAEAEPLFDRAYATQRSKLGDSHSETAKTMEALALLYERTSRESMAKAMRDKKLRTATRTDR